MLQIRSKLQQNRRTSRWWTVLGTSASAASAALQPAIADADAHDAAIDTSTVTTSEARSVARVHASFIR